MHLEHCGWYSIGVNSLSAALHGFIAAVSGNLAVTAELVHNIVDLVTSIAVLVSLKLATRQSKAFPYGLYKIEKPREGVIQESRDETNATKSFSGLQG